MPKAKLTTTEALLLVLDQVDYTAHACSPTDMVAACLDKNVIQIAREAIEAERASKQEAA